MSGGGAVSTDGKRLRQLIRSGATHGDVTTALAQTFASVPPEQTPALLVEVIEGLESSDIGYLVLPALRDLLRRDDATFSLLLTLALKRGTPAALARPLLDYV